jgi:hypothetical protein
MKHVKNEVASTSGMLNYVGYDSIKEVKVIPKIELHIYPPLSYEMTSKRVGALVLEIQVEQGDTLGDVLVRLDKKNHEKWKRLIDAQNKKMRPPVRTILNEKALSPSVLAHTPLSDGDQIKFVIIYGGG